MGEKLAFAATALLIVLAAQPTRADCICIGPGRIYHHGELACLKMPSGPQLSRCGMVLNNSAWLKVQDGCPVASTDPAPDIIHRAVPHPENGKQERQRSARGSTEPVPVY
jgi:hypothetical protein